jgi:hypothetical protein
VLAGDVQGIGLGRERPRIGGACIEAVSDRPVNLSLQHRALTGEGGACGQRDQDEGGDEALHLSPPIWVWSDRISRGG